MSERAPSAAVVGVGLWYLLGLEGHGRVEVRVGLEHLRGIGPSGATHTIFLMLGAGMGAEGR